MISEFEFFHGELILCATSILMAGLPGRDSQRTYNVVEKLAHLTLSSNRGLDICGKLPQLKPQLGRQPPPAMKAGAWHGHSAFPGRPHDIPSAPGYYTRKVAG